MDKIQPNRMDRGFQKYQAEFEAKALEVLRSGWYILGKEVSSFEEEFAAYVGSKHCVGVANGLDALWMAFRVLGIGPGDEVLVQGNTYIASVMGITMNGATPIFIEPDEYYQIDVTKLEEFMKRYCELLQTSENHSDLDYLRNKSSCEKLVWYERVRFYTELLFVYGLRTILVLLPIVITILLIYINAFAEVFC